MHVLIIPSWYPETPDDIDGIFFRQQAQALHRHGLKTGVIAPIFRSLRKPRTLLSNRYGISHYIEEGVPTFAYRSMYFFPRIPYIDRNRWVRAGKKLFDRYVLQYGKPDVIHVHSMNHAGILAHQIHIDTGIPYVITEHSSTYARKLIPDWQWPDMQLAAEHAAARIAVSRNFCTLLEEAYQGLPWQYIPNILPLKFTAPAGTNRPAPTTPFTFCSVAHLSRNKGYDLLIPAFAQALKKYPDLKLNIGGTGPEEAALHRLSDELGLGHAVTFSGALSHEQVLAQMQSSHAFVLASRVETFGVVFIEALSQGLPVVATRCGGPESIITPANGLLVPTDDIAALAAALLELYENHERYNSAHLRKQCLDEFGEHSIIAQLTEQYRIAAAHS